MRDPGGVAYECVRISQALLSTEPDRVPAALQGAARLMTTTTAEECLEQLLPQPLGLEFCHYA